MRVLIYGAATLVFGVMGTLLVQVLLWGLPQLSPSLLPALWNTLYLLLLTLGIALPLGIGAAVYWVEYAKQDSFGARITQKSVQLLASVPSVICGLFGFFLFVVVCGLGYSLLAGALTLALTVLPIVQSSTQDALRAVEHSLREASRSLGMPKLRTIFCVVLPSAANGIVSGILLSVGRIVGETAALLGTAGTLTGCVRSPMESGRSLAVELYCLLTEGFYLREAYAAAAALLLLVAAIHAASAALTKHLERGK